MDRKAYFRHFPKVLATSKEKHMGWVEARLVLPGFGGLFVGGNVSYIVFETGGIQSVFWQSPYLGE